MSIAAWEKVCEDAGVFVGGISNRRTRTKSSARCAETRRGACSTRAINYVDFKWALDLVAEKKGVSYRTLCEDILEGEGLAGEKNPYY